MEVTEGHSNCHRVELGLLLRELLGSSKVHEELTAPDELHHEENLLVSLENIFHADQEWVVSLHEDILFQKCGLDLVIIEDDVLSQRLHGIYSLILNFLDQEDFTKTSFANHTDDLEILELSLFFFLVFHEEGV